VERAAAQDAHLSACSLVGGSTNIHQGEFNMHMFRKAVIGLAAASMMVAPVAASAANSLEGARASSSVSEANNLGGRSGWIIGLVGLLAGVAAIIIIANDDDDAPVSP